MPGSVDRWHGIYSGEMLVLEQHVYVFGPENTVHLLVFQADENLTQRLKGVIDSTIAEEQARQRFSQSSPSRSNSRAKRPASRNLSPNKRAQGVRGRQDGDPLAKGPDPADFESEFVIEDDGPSRSGTPRPVADQNGVAATEKTPRENTSSESNQGTGETATSADEPRSSSDLPTDVRVKLRKLEKLESRYHGT